MSRPDLTATVLTSAGIAPATPPAAAATAGHAFLPAIAVASDGRVGLTYYDFRTLAPDNTTTLPTDIWFKGAPRGGNLATATETHVTGPFNFLAAPNAGGYFLGDYEGLAANGTSFVGVDDITTCDTSSCGSNPTDTYAFGLP